MATRKLLWYLFRSTNSERYDLGGNLLIDGGDQYLLEKQQRYFENISFWSFAAGVEGQFFDSDMLHFGLYLKYNFLNLKDILNEIHFPGSGLRSTGGSTEGLGIGFRVYFDFIPLLCSKP